MASDVDIALDEPHIAIFPTWPEGSEALDEPTLQIGAHALPALNSFDIRAVVLMAASAVLRESGYRHVAKAVDEVVAAQLAISVKFDAIVEKGIIPGGSDA